MRNMIQFRHDQVVPAQRPAQTLLDRQRCGRSGRHVKRLRMQLAALDTAQTIEDMDVPGFRLHPLKGAMRGRWSIWVNGNWRLTFEFQDGNAYVLDYEDYH
jgi:proteic killer suppression protein